MEKNNNKIIMVSFLITAILVGIVVTVMMETAAAVATGAFGRFVSGDIMRHGLPVVAGFAVFFFLEFNKSVFTWADEVVAEIRRVVWPSRRDTVAMTVVVCIMLAISGVTLGIFDVISGTVIDWLLHRNFGGFFS